jgi:hypothetical protein
MALIRIVNNSIILSLEFRLKILLPRKEGSNRSAAHHIILSFLVKRILVFLGFLATVGVGVVGIVVDAVVVVGGGAHGLAVGYDRTTIH